MYLEIEWIGGLNLCKIEFFGLDCKVLGVIGKYFENFICGEEDFGFILV